MRTTISRLAIAAALGWLAVHGGAAAAAGCTPKTFPDRDFPEATPEERPLAEAYYKADDAKDDAAKETAARAWLAYDEKRLGPGHWFIGFLLERLALAEGVQGKYEPSLAHLLRAEDIFTRTLGPDAPETRETTTMISVTYYQLKRLTEGEAAAKKASLATDAVACPESDDGIEALTLWGQSAYSAEHYNVAADIWREVVARRLRRFGPDDRELLSADHQAALNLLNAQRPQEVLDSIRAAEARATKLSGPNSEATLRLKVIEAQATFNLGRFKDAEAALKPLIETTRRALGPTSGQTYMAEETYLKVLIAEGDYERAPRVFEDLFRERAKGPDEAAAVDLAEIGADLYERLEQYAGAERIRRYALDAAVKTFGPDADNTLARLAILADLLSKDERPQEAEALLAPVWARIGAKAASEDQLGVGQSLANIYFREERYADAERILVDLSRRAERTLPTRSSARIFINQDLALTLAARGRIADGEALERQVWNDFKMLHGEAHPLTVQAALYVARMMVDEGRVQQRVQLIGSLLDTMEKAGQTTSANPTQLAIVRAMGRELLRYGLYDKAVDAWTMAYDGYLKIYGPDNSQTRAARLTLARSLGLAGQHAKAEPLFAQAAAAEEKIDVARSTGSSSWIVAEAGLGLSRTMQGKARDGYPALIKAMQAVYVRSNDRRITGSGAEEARQVLVDNRYVFNAVLRAGWAYAHEP